MWIVNLKQQMTHAMTGPIPRYLLRVGLAMSILLSVMAGGHAYQTLSARSWQRKRDGKHNLVRYIDFIVGEHHCMESWVVWNIQSNSSDY
jgi:hypothetical protein